MWNDLFWYSHFKFLSGIWWLIFFDLKRRSTVFPLIHAEESGTRPKKKGKTENNVCGVGWGNDEMGLLLYPSKLTWGTQTLQRSSKNDRIEIQMKQQKIKTCWSIWWPNTSTSSPTLNHYAPSLTHTTEKQKQLVSYTKFHYIAAHKWITIRQLCVRLEKKSFLAARELCV